MATLSSTKIRTPSKKKLAALAKETKQTQVDLLDVAVGLLMENRSVLIPKPQGTAIERQKAKAALPVGQAFVRGLLCNVLVCLAVWLSFAARSVTGKAVAIAFPITAFVALGFEHSVANMFFLPLGVFTGLPPDAAGIAGNLAAVTAGKAKAMTAQAA